MIGVKISDTSEEPFYRQLFEQLSSKILSGSLESGFNLPPIRTAAKELRVSIITVKKAWEELERAGLITSVVGKGCFVADLSAEKLRQKRRSIIKNGIKKDLLRYRKMGATGEEIIEIIQEFTHEKSSAGQDPRGETR
jgi:GntR family transcriptional regulator